MLRTNAVPCCNGRILRGSGHVVAGDKELVYTHKNLPIEPLSLTNELESLCLENHSHNWAFLRTLSFMGHSVKGEIGEKMVSAGWCCFYYYYYYS